VRLPALRAGRPPFTSQEGSWFSFLLEADSTQGHSAAGRIRSIEKSNNLIGIRTLDFPACSILPQPTALPRAPVNSSSHVYCCHDMYISRGLVRLTLLQYYRLCGLVVRSSWLQIQGSRVRFPALPDFLRSSGFGTGSPQPREDICGAT
jgi:hypothetical protein